MRRSGDDLTLTPLPDLVAATADTIADRLRRFGSRHWREPVGPSGATAADLVHDLVVACARCEAELRGLGVEAEVPERPAYDAALADRLAVTGRELADALRGSTGRSAAIALGGLLIAARDLRIQTDADVRRRALAELGVGSVAGDEAEDGLEVVERDFPGLRHLRSD